MRVLVVDDSNVIRSRIIRACLDPRLQGWRIAGVAGNGREAIEKTRLLSPDLVTMDLTMPEMDGLEAIRQLIEINPAQVILVISALSDKATAIESLKRGARGFLYKPFTDEKLIEALLEVMDQ